ncbi:MAG: DUF1552 domain-containing protein [Polyangiaceae bacterium]|nr:DUF1552 domain-containing protein [Polyangiaceae bacterium]
MVNFSRRSFVEKLGLGMGASLLYPIANSLIGEAQGQATERKVAIFLFVANGFHWQYIFPPPEFKEGGDSAVVMPTLNLGNNKTFTMPRSFKPLEPYRDRLLMVDGLPNQSKVPSVDGGHGMMYMSLSCMPPGDGPGDAMPGGITIDQYLAETLSLGCPRKSILIGSSTRPEAQRAALFAAGRNRPEPAIQSPYVLFQNLFGQAMASAASTAKGRVLFDSLKDDITRLEANFGVEEKGKLQAYLAAMEEFEKREQALGGIQCTAPTAPAVDNGQREPVSALESLHAIGSLGITCGISNVMGIDVGSGFSHDTMPEVTKLLAGTNFEQQLMSGISGVGHEADQLQGDVLAIIHAWLAGLIAKSIEDMKKVALPSGKNLYDNSLTVFGSDNGEQHHAGHHRWPLVLVGNAGGGIKADGRFLRWPAKGSNGSKALADLYSSLAVGFGLGPRPMGEVQPNEFGKGGHEPINGPLPEIMA